MVATYLLCKGKSQQGLRSTPPKSCWDKAGEPKGLNRGVFVDAGLASEI